MILAGLYVWWRRPGNESGLLLAFAGVAWFFPEWTNPGIGFGVVFTIGLVAFAMAPPLVAHAVLAYPFGRLSSAVERLTVTLAYLGAALVLGFLPALFFNPSRQGCSLCPPNLLLVASRPELVEFLNRWGIRLGLVWAIGIAALCLWRLARSSPPLRRLRAPVLVGGTAYVVLVWWDFIHSLPRGQIGYDAFEYRLWLAQAATLCLVALGVASSWLLGRRTRSAMTRMVVELGESPSRGGLREVLARSLGDPDLEVAYPVSDPQRLVDATGKMLDSAAREGRAETPLARRGETLALLLHRQRLLDDPAVVEELVQATRLALENERLQAEVLAQFEDLRASRARIVATGDAERRRLERDLHDGAQQRLVGLALALRLARAQLGPDPDPNVRSLIDRADQGLRVAIDELRELAHGVYPAVLTDQGLAAALETLVERSSIPIAIEEVVEGRYPSAVEAAAYFIIAEATGSIAVLADACSATIDVRRDGDRLVVEVTEDEVNDLHQELEARFIDLADRVGALDGRLSVEQDPDRAITIRAEIPCGS
jgi:signal transduction histidine kinase